MKPIPALICLLAALALAGCSARTPASGSEVLPEQADIPQVDVGSERVTQDVAFTGSLGDAAYVYVAGQGAFNSLQPGDSSLVFPGGRTLVGAELTLTWDALTPWHETLAADLFVMGPESFVVDTVAGPTGMALQVEGVDHWVGNESQVILSFYNPTGKVAQDPLFVGLEFDQAVTVRGTLTFEVPLAAGA